MKKGYRWYKCDLHLHTPASKCFKNKEVTAEEWVQACLDKGLHCVAVTDHNTNGGIAGVLQAAKGKGLFVFPGVEITCDSSGIHLLVLFDIGCTETEVHDFLSECKIKSADFGEQDIQSTLQIFDVIGIAKEHSALVIPAHIDEFNGLDSMKHAMLEKLYELQEINAVQVVHKRFVDNDLENIEDYLENYYGKKITIEQAKLWKKPVSVALEKQLTLLTFSDNPHAPKDSRHGIYGIGTRFTWIQMDQVPSLEGLRQAFLVPENRVQNDFEGKESPEKLPRTVIKSLFIVDSMLNKHNVPFSIDFHYQLNSIVGGPGSGKSSILRCIRGILNNIEDIKGLPEIKNDQNEFYKRYDPIGKRGIFRNESKIILSVLHDNVEYEIVAESIESTDRQNVKVYKVTQLGDKVEQTNPKEFLKFFQIEQYSQKQIYEISKEPSALRDKINQALPQYEDIRNELEEIKSTFLAQSAEIRMMISKIFQKKNIETEVQMIDNQIELFNSSGIEDILKQKTKFEEEKKSIEQKKRECSKKISEIDALISFLQQDTVDLSKTLESIYIEEISSIFQKIETPISSEISRLTQFRTELTDLFEQLSQQVEASEWNKERIGNDKKLEDSLSLLEERGVKNALQINEFLAKKAEKEQELAEIKKIEIKIEKLKEEKSKTQVEYFNKTKELSELRKTFVKEYLNKENIRITIKTFSDRSSFEKKVNEIIGLGAKYETDFSQLIGLCFKGPIEEQLEQFRKKTRDLKNEKNVDGVSKWFHTFFTKIDNALIDQLQIIVPEDEIVLEYKPKGEKTFKSLSSASAGQKATAVLTFILSFGDTPLILDQPEDDLNSKLVYELIVDKIKSAKKNRQIIIVTHNANIPVNADAELITCMNSSSGKIEIFMAGTLENQEIKAEICNTMEGSMEAFLMRAKRYEHIRI